MAEVVSITRPYEAPYVCDKCGADRTCQCKSKGVSRKTWENEASKAKKAVKNQGDSPAREKAVENIKESSEPDIKLFILKVLDELGRMSRETRSKFYDALWERFPGEF